MGGFSIWHWLIVLVVVVIVFGAGKLPRVASDLAQGIKNFKKGMQEPEQAKNEPPPPPAGHINAQNGAGGEQKPVADKVSS